jgi:Asp-tRNA(Asn)/Glu-tRNA(Gln) amidotransferase A subunit family amidase
MDYLDLTVAEMHKALLAGQTTPAELTAEAIARAKKDECNCFEAVNYDKALAQAQALKKIDPDSVFSGILPP